MQRDDKLMADHLAEERKKEAERAAEVMKDYQVRALARRPLEAQWQLNLNFLCGNQFLSLAGEGELCPEEPAYEWEERQVYNHLAPIIETRLAKLSRMSPSISVRAQGAEESDLENAKFSSKLIKSVFQSHDVQSVIAEANRWSETCGTAFYKLTWNASGGKLLGRNEGLPVAEGDVGVSVCPPFEIYPEDLTAMKLEDQRSLIQAKVLPLSVIAETYGVQVGAEPVQVFDLSRIKNPKVAESGQAGGFATVLERYTRPNGTYPRGRLEIVCQDRMLYEGDLPYQNGANGERDFPFVMQVCLKQTGCFFGASVLERLIPVQRAYNAVRNRKLEFLNRVAAGVVAVEDGSVDLDSLTEEGLPPGKVVVYRQGSNPPAFLDPGGVPSEFNYEEERLLNEFISISGVSEVMRNSQVPSTVSSGVALQLLIEQDDTRLSITVQDIRTAVKKMGQQILRLFQQFAGEGRLLKIAGEEGEVETFYFRRSAVTADDVVLDTENELSETPAQRKSLVLDLFKLGLFHDADGKLSDRNRARLLEIFGYGNIESGQDLSLLQIGRARKENLIGIPEGAMPGEADDDRIHLDEHTRYQLSAEFDRLSPAAREKHLRHMAAHRERLAQKEAAAALAGAAPQG